MERPVIMVDTDEMHVFCRNQCKRKMHKAYFKGL